MLHDLLAAKREAYGELSTEVGGLIVEVIPVLLCLLACPQVAHSLKLLASVLLSLGRVQQAGECLEKVLAIFTIAVNTGLLLRSCCC